MDSILNLPKGPVLSGSALFGGGSASSPCFLDLPGVVLTSSGRASIALALMSLEVARGDSVLVPTYHCPSMVSPVVSLGGRPLFYPITHEGMPDMNAIAAWVEREKPKAIIVAHYFGLPRRMAQIRQWCDRNGVALIEDCAHCLFGIADGRPVGSWGDFAIASLTKFLPVLEGGAIRAPDPDRVRESLRPRRWKDQLRAVANVLELAARHSPLGRMMSARASPARAVSPDAQSGSAPASELSTPPPEYLAFDRARAHDRIPAFNAILARKLPTARNVAARRANYAQLASRFAGRNGIRALFPDLPPGAAPYVFPVWVDEPDPGYQALRRLGLPMYRWDWLWPDMPHYPGDVGVVWARHVLQIGCHQSLDSNAVGVIADALARCYEVM